MQTLDIQHPDIPDLQFVLLVLALTTSDIPTLNVSTPIRNLVFDRCWALMHDTPPPQVMEERILDLRQGDEVTLEAMVEVIRRTLNDHGLTRLEWDHAPSETTRESTPEAKPLVDRLQKLYPPPTEPQEESPDPPNR
ncbi:MAG: hypothetical protein GKS05_05450 [Nitrospirales bacterium]|nr:hypothetical protein [Nitrospirales bacterium]